MDKRTMMNKLTAILPACVISLILGFSSQLQSLEVTFSGDDFTASSWDDMASTTGIFTIDMSLDTCWDTEWWYENSWEWCTDITVSVSQSYGTNSTSSTRIGGSNIENYYDDDIGENGEILSLDIDLSAESDGLYEFTIKEKVCTGWEYGGRTYYQCRNDSWVYQVVVDKVTPPTAPTISRSESTSYDGDFTISWSPNSTPIAGYELDQKIDNGSWSTTSYGSNVTSYSTSSSPKAEGSTYYYRVRGINSGGDGTNSATTSVSVPVNDTPSVSLESPGTGTSHELGDSISLRAAATDNNGISKVTFYYKNGSSGSTVTIGNGTLSNGVYSRNFTLPVESGSFRVWATATDTLSSDRQKTGTSNTAYLVVENNLPPVVTLSSSASSGYEYDSFTLTASASDSDGSVSRVQFKVNDSVLATDSSAPYSTIWTPTASGTYYLTATATDNEGSIATSQTLIVSVAELNPPAGIPKLTADTDLLGSDRYESTTGTYNLSWTTVSSATSYRVQECQDDVCVTLEQANHSTIYIPNQEEGIYEYLVTAYNQAGYGTPSDPLSVEVVLEAPSSPTSISTDPDETSAGDYVLTWSDVRNPLDGSTQPISYQIEEKLGTFDAATNWNVIHTDVEATSYRFTGKTSGDYSYRVTACNSIGCSDAGVQITVEVLPPYIGLVELDCNNGCLTLTGYALHADAEFEITALHDASLSEIYSGSDLDFLEPLTQVEVPLSVEMYDAMAIEQGIRITTTNPNGESGSTNASETLEEVFVNLAKSSVTLGYDDLGEARLYVGSGDSLHALNLITGEELSGWPFVHDGEFQATPVVGATNNYVYIGSTDDNMYAFNPNGYELWSIRTDGDIVAAGVLDEDTSLYFGSLDGVLYAAHSESGDLKWTYPAGQPIPSTPVLSGDGNTLYFTTDDGNVHAIGRGKLGEDTLVWDSPYDSLLADTIDADNWIPDDSHLPEYMRVGKLYALILQPELSFYRDVMTFWTYASLSHISLDETADAFLNSGTASANDLVDLTDQAFVEALYERAFPGEGQPEFTTADEEYDLDTLVSLLSLDTSRADIIMLFVDAASYTRNDNAVRDTFEYFYEESYEDLAFICDEGEAYERDCDADGLPDYWEIIYFGDIESQSTDDDPDNDGITNYQAWRAAIDPCIAGCYGEVASESLTPADKPEVGDIYLTQTDAIGSMVGDFRVSESGAATYSMPFSLAAGAAGVAPQLGISYSSQGGNGLVGQGWSLTGLSAISRCRQTLGQDGNPLTISWSDQDRFCLDGQRLILESGDYGDPGSTYRTETDGYARITARGGSNGHPNYFSVSRKDGSISYYGNDSVSNDSRYQTSDGNHTLTWALSRFEDSVGNGIDYLYDRDGGQHLVEIRYAYGEGSTANARVELHYSDDRNDPLGSYVGGYEFITDVRLESVEIYNRVDSVEYNLRTYTLDYLDYDIGFNRVNYLAGVQESRDGVELPATTFDWSYFDNGFSSNSFGAVTLEDHERKAPADYRPLDINGDGRMDFLWNTVTYDDYGDIDAQLFEYVIATDEGYTNSSSARYATADADAPWRMEILDYNADGRSDMAYFVPGDQWYVHLSMPDTAEGDWRLSRTVMEMGGLTDEDTRFVDINSDGLADAISVNGYRLLEPNPYKTTGASDYYHFGDEVALTVEGLDDWDNQTDSTASNSENNFYAMVNTDGYKPSWYLSTTIGYSYHRYLSPDAVGDFNGDGQVDLVLIDSEVRWKEESLFRGILSSTELSSQVTRYYRATLEGGTLIAHEQLMSFSQSDDFDDYEDPKKSTIRGRHSKLKNKVQSADLNGDGLSDLVLKYNNIDTATNSGLDVDDFEADDYDAYAYQLSNGNGFDDLTEIDVLPEDAGIQLIDYNFDGTADLVWSDRSDYAMKIRRWYGNELIDAYDLHDISRDEDHTHMLIDMTGDGRLDYVKIYDVSYDYDTYNQIYKMVVHPADEDGAPLNVITSITNGLGAVTEIEYASMAGNGHYAHLEVALENVVSTCSYWDVEYSQSSTYEKWFEVSYNCEEIVADSTGFYETLNGGFDFDKGWPFADEPPAPETLGKYRPVLEMMSSGQLVTRVASSAPAANAAEANEVDDSAMSAVSYYYSQAQLQAGGRGMLGFNSLVTVDEQTGTKTTTHYRQDFPFIGYPLSTVVETEDGQVLSESGNIWQLRGWEDSWGEVAANDGTWELGAFQPYIAKSIEKTYDLDSGELIQTVTTENDAPDASGNTTYIAVTTAGEDADGNTETFVQETTNTYGSNETVAFNNPEQSLVTYAQLGRLTRAEVIHKRTGQPSQARASEFSYYSSGNHAGMLLTEIVEPDNLAYELQTTHHYDDFGNAVRSVQTGWSSDLTTQITRDSGTATYDDIGRYMVRSSNSYGQTTSEVLAYNEYGVPTLVADINGVLTEIDYTPMGRQYLEYSATGAYRITLAGTSSDHCPSHTHHSMSELSAGGSEAIECIDLLGRSVRKGAQLFDGTWAYTDTEYDNIGRAIRQSEPHSGTAQYWTDITYDVLGRVVETELPGRDNSAKVSYSGLTTVTTNPLGQTKAELKNAQGELVRVNDHEGSQIDYEFDALGNLLSVTTSGYDGLSVTVTMEYDLLGRKTAMDDPDKGRWEYTYNSFGELREQTDAKGQRTTMSYDDLGRMVNRVDYRADGSIEGDSIWLYNNDNENTAEADQLNGRSALLAVQDSVSGYLKSYSYDSLGRGDETHTRLPGDDTVHSEKVIYDNIGRTYQVFDSAGDRYRSGTAAPSWADNVIQNRYNDYGYLEQVVDAVYINRAPGETYYTLMATDLRGNATSVRHGNLLTTYRTYDAATGLLETIRTVDVFGNEVQDQDYLWDDIGNLNSRVDNDKGLTEEFEYDTLNRLTSSQVLGQTAQTQTYDSLGNITYKSDVGYYSYGTSGNCAGTSGPHALCYTSDGIQYSYDANGNLISDTESGGNGGRTLSYTTFDKPDEIIKGGHTTQFAYGPDRSRYQRTDISTSGTKITKYLGNVEKITHTDGTSETKRYIGNVLISIKDNQSSTQYLHKDHLGSMDVITDSLANVVQEMSFDAWGARRSASLWTSVDDVLSDLSLSDGSAVYANTTRGFTGHEMLDEVGVVHMNGRIYDARLGRFLQADPHIQFVDSTQNYNRYSYLNNNPLNATDPTGYFVFSLLVGLAFVAEGAAVSAAWMVAFGIAAFADAIVQGASFKDALLSGFVGAFSAWAGGSIMGGGSVFGGELLGKTVGMGIVGGIGSTLQGGKFGHGFAAAGFSTYAGGRLAGTKLMEKAGGRIFTQAVIGGTVSRLSGGKFGNGAATAAFAAAVSAAVQRDSSGQFTDEDRQAAKAAADVYNDDTGGLLGELGIDYDPKDGFAASLTVDEDGKYTLTYRGTEGEGDWPANIRQALGKETSQYKQAISLARQVHRASDGNVLFVGHSLGGGLASAAAVATGSRAITFNAAGLHPNTISGTHGGIRAHYIRGDILSTLQDWTPFTPNAMGTRISHSGRGHPLARHSVSQFSGK